MNNRIYKEERSISLADLAYKVGSEGCSFAPAAFGNSRKASEVKQIQLLCLDFDNSDKIISLDEALDRSDRLDLPIAFAYETFSSHNCSKFRIVYRYYEPIVNQDFYKIMINIMFEIFPEADKATKDWSRIFFGGKGLLTEVKEDLIYPAGMFSALYYLYGSNNNREKCNKIRNFALNNGMALMNKTFYVETMDYRDVKSLDKPILYNIAGDKSFTDEVFVIHLNSNKNTVVDNEKRFSENMINHIKNDDLYSECRLIRDLKDGKRWLYYPELWGILTNLVHIYGGLKYFRRIMDTLEKTVDYPYKYDKWRSNCTQISKSPYAPKKCEDYCPYSEECKHGKNIITTVNISKKEFTVLNNNKKYVDEATAREKLYTYTKEALISYDNDIHILSAQTGLGKTYTYIRCIKDFGINCIIAVPTSKLKNEVYNRMLKEGIAVKMTPALPEDIEEDEKETLKYLYKKGDIYGYKEFMTVLSKKYESIRSYTNELKEAINYSGNIITTHFRLLYQLREKTLNNHTIIIDEDIINTMFHTDSIKLSDLSHILSMNYIKKEVRDRIKYYTKKDYDKLYKKHISEPPIFLSRSTMKKLSRDPEIDFNLFDFLNSKATMVDIQKGIVYYAWCKDLPNQKVIITSATANEKVYATFFKNRHIRKYPIEEVKYKGKVLQYTEDSFSRNWIDRNPEKFEELKKI